MPSLLPSGFPAPCGSCWEGALSAAFIPVFTRTIAREGREAAWTLASKVLGTLIVVLATVTTAGILLAPWIVQALAPGFGQVAGKLELTVTLLRIMFPYIFLVGIAALFMATLNSLGHFLTPALSPTILNAVMICTAVLVAPRSSSPVLPIAVAVVIGGIGQLAIQVPAALRCGWRPAFLVAPGDPAVRAIARLMLPGVAGLAVTQVNVFVGTLLASLLSQGSVAAMTYAFAGAFPIGMVGVAIATGALPVMAAAFAREAISQMKRALHDSPRLAVFPRSRPWWPEHLRRPIIGFLSERGVHPFGHAPDGIDSQRLRDGAGLRCGNADSGAGLDAMHDRGPR